MVGCVSRGQDRCVEAPGMCMVSVGRVYTAPAATDVLAAPSHLLFVLMTEIVSTKMTGSSDEIGRLKGK